MIFVLLFSCVLSSAFSANILAVFPHPGKSHFDVFEPLVLELAARGHQVTVVSFYPQRTPVANYTDVSLVGTFPLRLNRVKVGQPDDSTPDSFSVSNVGLYVCEKVLKSGAARELLQSDARFDLVILEMFDSDCFLGLVHKYGAPYVGFNSAKTSPDQDGIVGTPTHPAYVSHINLPFTNRMSLLQRVANVTYTVVMAVKRFFVMLWEQWGFYRLMGEGVPPLELLARNASLILVNTHFSLLGSRPLVPAHIEVGGIHLKPPKPVSKELDDFLNGSPEGAIVFSMGSVLKSSSFPVPQRQAIMEAFAELPVRVVMKWENDSLPGKPDNVLISNWLPQRDVLAHPKVRAFMGHGGLLSTGEAVDSGVPMVLVPMFGDQGNNVAHLSSLGAAVRLDFDYISKESVLEALRAVLDDPSYREKTKELSERFRDRPMSPLDTAVYWTEYVLRHKGARHLRSPAVDMAWYQLWLLDVALVLLSGLAALSLLVVWLTRLFKLSPPQQSIHLGTQRKKTA